MELVLNIQWNWEDMCGPAGLHPWSEDSKDIGQCFQELFLQIPIYFLIAIISGYYVGYRKDWVVREKTQERAVVFRSFVVLALAVVPIIELYVFVTSGDFVMYPIIYFVGGASCLSWLVHFGYVLALKHRLGASSRGPLTLLVLWGFAVVFNVLALRSNTIAGTSVVFNIVTLCCHALYFITLIPSSDSRPTFYSPCLVGSQHTHSEYTPLLPHIDEGVLGTAMQSNNWLSKLTFSWVNPLLQKGLENKLHDVEELFDIPAKYSCYYVGARMDRALIGNVDNYQQFAEIPHEPFISTGYGSTGESGPQASTPVTPTARVLVRPLRKQNVALLRALHSCFGLQFYSIGILRLISDMTGFAGPLLLNKLVAFIQDTSIDMHYGYIYSAGLLISTLVSAFFNVHFDWRMSIIRLKMRGALVYAILGKTLSVTSTELTKRFTVGEITNFMSTDTDRILNSCSSFHAMWSIPLQLFITLFLLYQQVGISFLAGVAFSVLLIPINKIIANKIGKISTELMKHKDSRVNLISDLIRGIRTIKVHVWEDYFINRVSESRSLELKSLRGRKYLDAICVVLWATTPVLVAALTLGTHAARRQPLDAPTVFTSIALINMLIGPLNAFPWVLNGLTEAWVSIKRIQALMDLEDMDSKNYYDRVNRNDDEDKIIIFRNATFAWAKPSQRKTSHAPAKKSKGKSKRKVSKTLSRNVQSSSEAFSDEPFVLNDIDLVIGREQLVGITGPVGSGKTSLLHAIIGDMIKKRGDIQIPENLSGFGYVSQKPWLIRGTIKDNILFGKAYDETKFHSVVEACALTEDLNVLGWNAFVGEGGCTLSGGQRARISLARAVYQEKQVYLLDDVLSGVDARVAQHIMQKCILGLLKRTTRIMVTHSHTLLARANYAVLLHDGKILKQGFPEMILNDFEEYLPSDDLESSDEEIKQLTDSQTDNSDNISRNSMDVQETMSEGTVAWWVICMYLRAVGWFLSIAILLSLLLMQLSQNFTFVWLAYWVKNRTNNATSVLVPLIETVHDNSTVLEHSINAVENVIHNAINMSISLIHNMVSHSNKTDAIVVSESVSQTPLLEANVTPVYNDHYYLEVYFGLAGLNLVFTIMRAFLFAYGGVQAAEKIHKILLKVIVRAKVKFFDVTPAGRILNRFSSDTYTVDDSLPFILNILLAQTFSLTGAVVVTVYGLPWLLVTVFPIVLIYYWLQRRYRMTSRQIKRLQSTTLSPIYAHFNDTLEGLTTVRAFHAEERWRDKGSDTVLSWQRTKLCAASASCWLALRLQSISACVVACSAGVAVLQRSLHAADPGLVGLAISYALSMTSILSSVLNSFAETEREMIAVERVGEYITQVESEKIDGESPPYGWPSQGVVSFENVSLKYSESSPLALNDVSFTCRPSERVGVAGRTGGGKSSLLHAILRTAPLQRGRVAVDTVDLATLHLHALRSRIGLIPQEPFVFSGTVRENVDPLRQYSETETWRALERAGAAAALQARGGLNAEPGALSRGNLQLLALARALLQRPKILLVDEATANVDQETERLILDTIRSSFAGCTVLLVAHRVVGVLECSRVLVMGKGQVLEFDSPDSLLSDPTSQLYSLVHAHDQ